MGFILVTNSAAYMHGFWHSKVAANDVPSTLPVAQQGGGQAGPGTARWRAGRARHSKVAGRRGQAQQGGEQAEGQAQLLTTLPGCRATEHSRFLIASASSPAIAS